MPLDPEKLAACYGPIGKAGWDAIEAEIDRQCEGMNIVEKYGCSFTLNLETGEVKMNPRLK